MLTEKDMPLLTVFEMETCGKSLVVEEALRSIDDVNYDDLPCMDDVSMWYCTEDIDRVVARFTIETNSEVLYEVSYTKKTRAYYVSTYSMTQCVKVDSPREN